MTVPTLHSAAPTGAARVAPDAVAHLLLETGADPWVIWHEGVYYYCGAQGDTTITVRFADTLDGLADCAPIVVWTAPAGTAYCDNVWAPELHRIDGAWYIYFAADDGDNANHRMYVLTTAADRPVVPFDFVGKITDATDRWAIDGTVLILGDRMWFVWSGWDGTVNGRQNLYVAEMDGPTRIVGPRVLISTPEHDWECIGRPLVNEGPQVLQRGGRTFLVYSASGSWTDDYCLGLLELVGDNPCDPAAWVKHPVAVFSRTADVPGPGHASFVVDVPGQDDQIVYHAAKREGSGWDREVRAQGFGWAADGFPLFGAPLPAQAAVGGGLCAAA